MARGFTPDYKARSISGVSVSYLREIGADGVIADLDNTLALPDDIIPTKEGAAWLAETREAGIRVVIVSNNSRRRVENFCASLGVDFVYKSGKPFGRGISRAIKKLGVPPERTVLIGDQIFTDVLAASYNRIRCILTEPIVMEDAWFFKFKRSLERFISRK